MTAVVLTLALVGAFLLLSLVAFLAENKEWLKYWWEYYKDVVLDSSNRRPWYDNREGVVKSLRTLKGFNELIRARHNAGYDRKERLNEWFILGGRWTLDTCGNTMKAMSGYKPWEKFRIPRVIPEKDFWSYLELRNAPEKECIQFSWSSEVPSAGICCPECGEPWTIQNTHSAVVTHESHIVPLNEYVGMTMAEVQKTLDNQQDADRWLSNDTWNDCRIDTRPDARFPDLQRNRTGRLHVGDSYTIQPGDSGLIYTWIYRHPECQKAHLRTREEQYFREMFRNAGLVIQGTHAIQNRYCNCPHCAPWFLIDTNLGQFTVGWRKRVIHIGWDNQVMSKVDDPLGLFSDENVTKGDSYIHAWGMEKGIDYLQRFEAAPCVA